MGSFVGKKNPFLARFMITHMNQGKAGDVQLLEPATTGQMHAPAVKSSADIGMAAYGYGWTLRRQEPWNYWDTAFEMRSA